MEPRILLDAVIDLGSGGLGFDHVIPDAPDQNTAGHAFDWAWSQSDELAATDAAQSARLSDAQASESMTGVPADAAELGRAGQWLASFEAATVAFESELDAFVLQQLQDTAFRNNDAIAQELMAALDGGEKPGVTAHSAPLTGELISLGALDPVVDVLTADHWSQSPDELAVSPESETTQVGGSSGKPVSLTLAPVSDSTTGTPLSNQSPPEQAASDKPAAAQLTLAPVADAFGTHEAATGASTAPIEWSGAPLVADTFTVASEPDATTAEATDGAGDLDHALLEGFDASEVIDVLAAMADVLEAVTDRLAQDLEFLATDLPILGFNLLDLLDFSSGFVSALDQLDAGEQVTLQSLEAALGSVFGDTAVGLAFDAQTSILAVDLDLSFISESLSVPLSVDLVSLLGGALESTLGEGVADFISNMTDTRGEAALAVDATVALDLSFGLDLSGLLAPEQAPATDEALLVSSAVAAGGAAAAGGRTSGAAMEEGSGEDSAVDDAESPIRAFIDTEQTSLSVEFSAGVPDLNILLGLGPLEAAVVDGHALIGAGDGSGAPARIAVSFGDMDGDAFSGQLDLDALLTGQGTVISELTDLLQMDASVGIDAAIPLADSLGLFDAAEHGLFVAAELIATDGAQSLAGLASADLSDIFGGVLVDLAQGQGLGEDSLSFNLPDLSEFFSDFNVLEVLNNPRTILDGVDSLLGSVESAISGFLGDLSLPIVGGNLASAVTIFDDIRAAILDPAIALATMPDADGNLPTTVDLLTGFMNDQFNSLLGTQDVEYIQAFLDTSGGTADSFIYGAFSFSGELFNEALDIGFDFGIPGFEIELEEGSAINLAASFDAYIGFGIDSQGFFLLNDTDQEEISVTFSVDANTFQGSFTLAEVLGLSAVAVPSQDQLAEGELVLPPDFENGEEGVVQLVAAMEVDLFGSAGTVEERDFGGIEIIRAAGTVNESVVGFENTVRVHEIIVSELVDIDFSAEVDVNLQLGAQILNPLTGGSVQLGGVSILPQVATDLIFQATFDTAADDLFVIDALEFSDVRISLDELYEALIAPVLDPIIAYLEPIAGLLELISVPPISFAIDALGAAFPIIRTPLTVAEIAADIGQLAIEFAADGGNFIFGDFDLLPSGQALAEGSVTTSGLGLSDGILTARTQNTFGEFGERNGGVLLTIPLLADPSNALALLLGNFEDVALVDVQFSLIDMAIDWDPGAQTAELISDALPLGFGSLVGDLVEVVADSPSVFSLLGFFGFNVGYDLQGVSGFLESYNPIRLLDGLFINSGDGSLLDLAFSGDYVIPAFGTPVAGIFGGIDGELALSAGLNDPNDDGQLRIPEILALAEFVLESSPDLLEFLEIAFIGDLLIDIDAVYEAILGPLTFDGPIFTVPTIEETFSGADLPEQFATMAGDGSSGQVNLNVGTSTASALSEITTDGDESIVVNGSQVSYDNNGETRSFALPDHTQSLFIPAGQGNNLIDLSGASGLSTLVATGEGTDTLVLPGDGFHVVFAGEGSDSISIPEGATGTYWIFGGDGADIINASGGNTVIFGAEDYQLRDAFLANFASGGFSQSAAEQLINDLMADTGSSSGAALRQGGDNTDAMAAFMADFTVQSQNTAGAAADEINLGGGSHTVFAGGGADRITSIAQAQSLQIFAGAGDDVIRAAADQVLVEGGAGADLIVLGDGTNTVYGYSKSLGDSGETEDRALNTMARADGDDVILGGSGVDHLYGQRGDNLLMGGLGDDLVHGGTGDDILTGGVFDIIDRSGQQIAAEQLIGGFGTALTVQLAEVDDGADTLLTGRGNNLALGGAGSDQVTGGASASLLIGDFAQVDVTSSGAIERMRAAAVDSDLQGADTLVGGMGRDILVGGGSADGQADTLSDLHGSNLLIGDHADVDGIRILDAVTRVDSVASAQGNADRIEAGGGHDILLGGEAGDDISAAGGNNIVLGDSASLHFAGGQWQQLESLANTAGGADSIQTGNGHDIIIAGERGDTVRGAGGDDIITGDLARLDAATNVSEATVATLSSGLSGDDVIDAGAANDIVLGGAGSDQIEVGAGEDLGIGDDARVGFVNRTDAVFFENLAADDGAADRLSSTGIGDSVLMGQGGADEITGSESDDILIGDLSSLEFMPLTDVDASASLVERVQGLADVRSDLGFDDVILGGDGRDLLLGGFGADRLDGQAGQDLLAGDSFIVTRGYQTDRTGEPQQEQLQFESRLPFDQGGNDTLIGGAGNDIIIGGLGPDQFFGNTEQDYLAGDSAAIYMVADFAADDSVSVFDAERFLDVVTVNFPGLGAQDVLSISQVNDVTGGALEERERRFGFAPDASDSSADDGFADSMAELLRNRTEALLDQVASQASDQSLALLLAELASVEMSGALMTGLAGEALIEQIRAALASDLSALDRYLLDAMLRQLLDASGASQGAAQPPAESAVPQAA